MATRVLAQFLLTKNRSFSSHISRSCASLSLSTPPSSLSSLSTISLLRLRPLVAVTASLRISPAATTVRGFATRQTTSSLNDSNPNWSNRPPKETILLDGCDFEHWLVVMEPPEGDLVRDEIIDSYIKTLATVVGSEEEARMKIYSVSTRCYFAFGALVSEELSYKLKELPRVRWVLPDSYLDVKNKDYGGEPFINGQAVPYDPKYHEEWIRNHERANERNRRNDRPRNFDRSRNFERRRENMQNRGNMGGPQSSNMGGPSSVGGAPPNNTGGAPPSNFAPPPPSNFAPPPNMGGMQHDGMGGPSNFRGAQPNWRGPPAQNNMGGMSPQNNMGGMPPQNMGRMPPQNNIGGMPPQNNMGGMPPQNNMGGMPPQNMGRMPPQNNIGGMPPQNNMGGMPHYNMGGMPHSNNVGGMHPNNMGGMPNDAPNFQPRNGPSNGGMPYQTGPGQNRDYQNSYGPNVSGGNPYQTQDKAGDVPPPPIHQ